MHQYLFRNFPEMSDSTEFREGSSVLDDGEEVKRPCLIMIKGDFIGQVYELENNVTMIGRSDEVELVISGISMSRKHAMIVDRSDGYYVFDLVSITAVGSTRTR